MLNFNVTPVCPLLSYMYPSQMEVTIQNIIKIRSSLLKNYPEVLQWSPLKIQLNQWTEKLKEDLIPTFNFETYTLFEELFKAMNSSTTVKIEKEDIMTLIKLIYTSHCSSMDPNFRKELQQWWNSEEATKETKQQLNSGLNREKFTSVSSTDKSIKEKRKKHTIEPLNLEDIDF